jgi:YVTN family beta-propeller protein
MSAYPKSIFLTPDGGMAWVNFTNSSTLYVVDTRTLTASGTVNAGGVADTGMAFSPDGTRAYVSVYSTGQVAVFNTATLVQIASIPVSGQPTDIVVSKDGSRAYVNSYATSGAESVIDLATNTVVTSLPQTGPAMGLTIFH